jgi:2'-5' RNA ligase
MDNFSQSVMLALLPISSEWCKIELPHLTLVYIGEINSLSPTAHNELAKISLNFAFACAPMTLSVIDTAVFGETDKVDVLSMYASPELLAIRGMVEEWNGSQHPFNPHVTIGPEGTILSDNIQVPKQITFDRIAVGWGDSLLQYKFLGKSQ